MPRYDDLAATLGLATVLDLATSFTGVDSGVSMGFGLVLGV